MTTPLITSATVIEWVIAEADPGTIVVAVTLPLPPLITGGTVIKQVIDEADPGTIVVAVISISHLYSLAARQSNG